MKPRKSILDPHAAQLAEWEAQNISLADMQAGLAKLGCKVSLGRLSTFLSARRRQLELQAARKALFGVIKDGAETNRELDRAFAENPAPALARLVEMTKSLVFDLKIQAVKPDGSLDPLKVKLAADLTREMTETLKLLLKERETDLNREKFEHLKAREDQAKAVLAQPLSDAEKAARIKEIYGLA